ncbi:hypothetical protein QL285_071195 [Trifolium repens]|nr:hypothetical protein QL285_071195 [Trifolium repens]
MNLHKPSSVALCMQKSEIFQIVAAFYQDFPYHPNCSSILSSLWCAVLVMERMVLCVSSTINLSGSDYGGSQDDIILEFLHDEQGSLLIKLNLTIDLKYH